MPIHLYQSKKVQRYIGKEVYMDMPWAVDQVDPLTVWYADVFFVNRARYLVIANPLTKFTFFIFRYSRKTHPDFEQAFRDKLVETMRAADIDPTRYLQECHIMVPFEQSNRSASAHLSRIKYEYEWMIKDKCHNVDPPHDELYYNQTAAKDITTYGGKDYDRPFKRFYHELLLRRWV